MSTEGSQGPAAGLPPHCRLIVNLLGAPGAGKGTQAALLSQLLRIPHVAVGDLFRRELLDVESSLGRLLRHHFDTSNVDPPDEIAAGLLARRLTEADCRSGFILEGFPRSALEVDTLLHLFVRPDDRYLPILLRIDAAVALARLRHRRVCPPCGVHLQTTDSLSRCPTCSGPTAERVEDRDMSYSLRRLASFDRTLPLIRSRLLERSSMIEIDVRARDTPRSTCQQIATAMDAARDGLASA